MLKHEESLETPAQTAAQARVTPQELAAALARLEARQGGLDGTIPLGDAVQELGLNATPEELLREIEAGRAVQHERPPQIRPVRRLPVALGGLACGVLLLGSLFAIHVAAPTPPAPVAAMAVTAAPQAAPIGILDTLLVQRPDHKMVLLSEVADGQPVFCDLAATENGARLTDFAPATYHWTLIKHGGQVYVRGWIGDMSDTALRATVVAIQPTVGYGNLGVHPIRVTLPLSGFQSSPGLTNDDMISATHIVPDSHLKEKW